MCITHTSARVINHKTMRKIIGAIAIALPPVSWWLSNHPGISSISFSYWTDSGDIFVGSLLVVGFFLVAYNGTGGEKDWEFWLSKIACAFAVGIALFPVDGKDPLMYIPPQWITTVCDIFSITPGGVHRFSTVAFFCCLIALMFFFSNRAKDKGKPRRSFYYRAIALLMLFGLPLILLIGHYFDWANTIFAVEWIGLWLFGFGWLLAGWYKDQDEEEDNPVENEAPEAA